MEQNTDHKIELKDKLFSIYNSHKKKINAFIISIMIAAISITLLELNNKKKNSLIAEKYIEAGILLSSKKNEDAKELLKEIIYSKNKFYSILALNIILEKNLFLEKEEILKYFKIVEKLKISQEQKDLIDFKKALYLIKISQSQEGSKLLKKLIDKNSRLKFLIEVIKMR